MKAVSLNQPWATLVAIGAKQNETRSHRTNHRGFIAIHASLNFPIGAMRLCEQETFKRVLVPAGFKTTDDLPRGVIVAVADLTACLPAEDVRKTISDQERAFGNYDTGRWAWQFRNIRPLKTPIESRGMPGLFEVDDETINAALA